MVEMSIKGWQHEVGSLFFLVSLAQEPEKGSFGWANAKLLFSPFNQESRYTVMYSNVCSLLSSPGAKRNTHDPLLNMVTSLMATKRS